MKTIVVEDKNMERHGLFVKFVRIFTVPVLNNLPANFLRVFMKKSSQDAGVVLDLEKEILRIIGQNKEKKISILTIGGGSARGLVEVLNKHSDYSNY